MTPPEQSFMPGTEPAVVPAPKAPVPIKHIPNYEERKRKVVAAWNRIAAVESVNWARCSKVPTGKVGKLLDARVREPWWCFFAPFGLSVLASFTFYKENQRKFKLESFIRPDALRAILDGEWDKGLSDLQAQQLATLQEKWCERKRKTND